MKNKTWEKMHTWSDVLPPSRPDVWQLKIIENYLDKFDSDVNIAVLGSTIEFVDLIIRNGKNNIYVFEKNEDFYLSQNKYRAYLDKEKLILGDWLDTLKDYENYFHIILSDLTIGNIEYKYQNSFLRKISSALCKEGVFIDRILTHQIEKLSLDSLFHKYERLPLNLRTINDFSSEFLFCSELLNTKSMVDSTVFYETIIELSKNPQILKFVEFSQLVTPYNCYWWYGKEWSELQTSYMRYFEILQEFDEPENSVYFKRVKLFISRVN